MSGNSTAGKSCLIKKYVKGYHGKKYIATVYAKWKGTSNSVLLEDDENEGSFIRKDVRLTFTDTDGDVYDMNKKKMRCNELYKNADIQMICVSAAEEIRSEDINAWRNEFL